MNENIETDFTELESKAQSNVSGLFCIEEEIFGHSFNKGKIVPNNPEYWDINSDGTTNAFLRFSP